MSYYNYNNMALNFQILQMFLNQNNRFVNFNEEKDLEFIDAMTHLKTEYYPQATYSNQHEYLLNLVEYKKNHHRYPTRREFFLMCRNICLCPYYLEDNEYIRAAEFFIKSGEYLGNIPCDRFYYFYQYYLIEQREPSSVQEFLAFYRRSIMVEINPSLIENDVIARPVKKEKINQLKESIFEHGDVEENCSICQDPLEKGQKCVKLDCGHVYHAEECCESGNIFKWFEDNRICPVCRKEM